VAELVDEPLYQLVARRVDQPRRHPDGPGRHLGPAVAAGDVFRRAVDGVAVRGGDVGRFLAGPHEIDAADAAADPVEVLGMALAYAVEHRAQIAPKPPVADAHLHAADQPRALRRAAVPSGLALFLLSRLVFGQQIKDVIDLRHRHSSGHSSFFPAHSSGSAPGPRSSRFGAPAMRPDGMRSATDRITPLEGHSRREEKP
jgi:hypothetical protein